MVKYAPHTYGKCACILTCSLEGTKCGREVSSPNKWILRSSKLEFEFLMFSLLTPGSWTSSQTFHKFWATWSFNAVKFKTISLKLHDLAIEVAFTNPGEVKSSYKSDVLKICAHEVGSEQHQNKEVDFKSSCKNWSWYFNLGQKKWNMNRHPSPMHNKRSEVLLHHLPTFKLQTCSQVLLLRKKISSKFPSAFLTSRTSRSTLSTYEGKNIGWFGWFILKFNLLLVSSTKSPLLLEVARSGRSFSWQKSKKSQRKCFHQLKRAKYATRPQVQSSSTFYLVEVPLVLYQVQALHAIYSSLSIKSSRSRNAVLKLFHSVLKFFTTSEQLQLQVFSLLLCEPRRVHKLS